MNLEHFPHFFGANYPEAKADTGQVLLIGLQFKDYLRKQYSGQENQLEMLWDIDPVKADLNRDHPLKPHGYDPGLVLHFYDFIQEVENRIISTG